MEVLGLPPKEFIGTATRRRLFFDSRGTPRCITNTKGRKRTPGSKTLSQILLCQDRYFINFLQRCLEWDPAERMTPEEAAHHEFLQPSSANRHRSCRMSSSSSTSGLSNNSSQKSSCYNFSDNSASVAGAGHGSGPVVASITNTSAVSNAAISTTFIKPPRSVKNGMSTHHQNHAQSSGHLPEIKLSAGEKFNSMQKMAVHSKITSSVSDLESAQQYSLQRMYNNNNGNAGGMSGSIGSISHNHISATARKHIITSGTIATSSSKYGHGITGSIISANYGSHNHHNVGNLKGSVSNSLSGSGIVNGHHHHHHLHTNDNSNNNMSHSQSTGDVSAIFGRA